MIPLPPSDPALHALATSLDGDAMAEQLQRNLPDCVQGRLQIRWCRPCYVRYKQRTSCLVQYELGLRDATTGVTIETIAHAKLYGHSYGRKIWPRRSTERLVERAARHNPELPTGCAVFLPELRALVQLYPVDRELPGLVSAASSKEMEDELGRAALAQDTSRFECRDARLIRYKPARKALLRYSLSGASFPAVYGKLHANQRGATLFKAGQELGAAGVSTAQTLAYLPRLRMLVHAEAPGTRLAELRDRAEYFQWMGLTAETLARLHAGRIDSLSPHSPRDEADTTLTAGRTLATLLPDRAAEIDRLVTSLASHLECLVEPEVTVHGDFYDDQVLVADGRAILLDFDGARLGSPLLDLGNFIGHLSAGRGHALDGAGTARTVFLDAYQKVRPARLDNVLLYEAAALTALAVGPFRRLEPDWPEQVERLIRLAETRLAEHRQRGLVTVRGTAHVASSELSDPALPQLAAVQDPRRIGTELSRSVYGAPTSVTDLAVVRYKQGRRCTLRYDVLVAKNGDQHAARLFAKTFASERGPRVYSVLGAIATNRACGPGVALPEPVAYLPSLKLLLQREVPGSPFAQAMLQGNEQLGALVADALHALHTSGLDLPGCHDLRKELAPLEVRVERLAAHRPALSLPARRCLVLLRASAVRPCNWRWRPIHRDFYHDQILVGEHGLSVLDFDDAAMSEPAVDVANFLAHLRLLALQMTTATSKIAAVAAAFERSYRRLDRDLHPDLVRLLEGATLLRLAEIHLPRRRGEWIAERLLEQAGHLLADSLRTSHGASKVGSELT
jgi:Ser/Thr protein kinase RdoA (MazF antagonist)